MESKQAQKREGTQAIFPTQAARRCANCDIEFLWPAVVVQGKTYCCAGCARGGPCSCDYSQYRSVNISGVIHYGPGKANGNAGEETVERSRGDQHA